MTFDVPTQGELELQDLHSTLHLHTQYSLEMMYFGIEAHSTQGRQLICQDIPDFERPFQQLKTPLGAIKNGYALKAIVCL